MDLLQTLSIKANIENPLNPNEINCTLKNNRKDSYYIHKYNPTFIIQTIKQQIGDFLDDELDILINEKFQTNTQSDCCNCISLVLYLKCDIELYQNYIQSIYRTVLNVKRNLVDWIVRIYFDKSVYECLETDKDKYPDIYNCFEIIFNSPNTEIYTFDCPLYNDEDFKKSKLRSLRFLPIIDNDTNICVFRDADGIVTNQDCHNLKIFKIHQINYFI